MTKLKTLAAAISAICLISVSAPSLAAPTLKFKDGATNYTVDPFGGFEWQSNATAVVTAPTFDGATVITTSFLASAEAIKKAGGASAVLAGFATNYEFTIKATITEVGVCVIPNPVPGGACISGLFTATGGSFDIYYDQQKDSNILTGVGFTDGTKILSGTINPGIAGSFTLGAPDLGFGIFTFEGVVSSTETDSSKDAYFAPALATSTATSTLQFGRAVTDWTAPTTWVEGGLPGPDANGDGIPDGAIVFQADGNQSFTAKKVPEPGSLALVGLSLVGLAFARRSGAKK